MVGAGISTPNFLKLQAEVGHLQQRLHDLRDHVGQERQERLSLEASVQRYRLHRSYDQSEFAFSELENERGRQAIRDEVAEVHHHMAKLQSQIDKMGRDQKNLQEVLERGGGIRPRKKTRADGTGGDNRNKT